jgi:hypothetical protein
MLTPYQPKSSINQCLQFKSVYNAKTVPDRRQMSMEHEYETMVALSTDDVTSTLKRPLATEIDIPP